MNIHTILNIKTYLIICAEFWALFIYSQLLHRLAFRHTTFKLSTCYPHYPYLIHNSYLFPLNIIFIIFRIILFFTSYFSHSNILNYQKTLKTKYISFHFLYSSYSIYFKYALRRIYFVSKTFFISIVL